MTAGDWLQAIQLVREEAGRLGVPSDDMVRQVAARAIECGLVQPIRQVPVQ